MDSADTDATQAHANVGTLEPVEPPSRDPATLNGDWAMSKAEVAAYLEYHARRNSERARASRGIRTEPGPWRPVEVAPKCSPSRVNVSMFFEFTAECAMARFGTRPITIVDLGCGRGNVLAPFAARGMSGQYVGIDIARHSRWSDAPMGGFTRRLLLHDIHRMDPAVLPLADVVTSCTALEHIRDDAGAVRLLASRTAPGGLHAHAVPGEAGLALFGTHGWRQYSPADMRALFPGGTIYRYGGALAHAWHAAAIPDGADGWMALRDRAPSLYALVRNCALIADRELGECVPTTYAALWSPWRG